MPDEEWDVMQALSRQSAVARTAQLCRERSCRATPAASETSDAFPAS